ncbi:MAG TPA: cobaltochelatase subunit CobN, partial [Pirellulales bacterium]
MPRPDFLRSRLQPDFLRSRLRIAAQCGLAAFLLLCCDASLRGADMPAVGFVGAWERSIALVDRAARETGIGIEWLTSDKLINDEHALDGVGVLFVLNLDPKDVTGIIESLRRAKTSNPGLTAVALDQRDVHATLLKAELLKSDAKVPPYWRANGLANIKRLLSYAAATYLGRDSAIEPPLPVPDAGYFDSARADPFDNFGAYRAYKIAQKRWFDDRPVAVLMIQQSFWITEDTKVINAQAAALEKRGINVAVIFGDTHERVNELIRAAKPDVLIEDRHGGNWPKDALESLDVPYVRPISMLGSTIDEWLKNPRGMAHRDVGLFMTVQESKGTIEPMVVGGLKASVQGFRVHEPIADRIERFADRTKKWLDLRAKKNADKRIAIIYYNKSLGKDDLLRGSPTGAFLDGPKSLVRFLPELKAKGYEIAPVPQTAEELLGWVKAKGRNIGPWARAELEQLVTEGEPTLIPLAKYQAWFNAKLTEAGREAVLKHHGPPPGKLMTISYNGAPHIVLPHIELGNVLLAPQPERGEKQDDRLIHSRDVPPPH